MLALISTSHTKPKPSGLGLKQPREQTAVWREQTAVWSPQGAPSTTRYSQRVLRQL